MTTGRRKIKRYRVIEDVFAVTKSNPNMVGNILDISSRGLSFQCLANGEFSDETFEIDIFFRKNRSFLKGISCKRISVKTEHSKIPFSALIMRRVGVKFFNIKRYQFGELIRYLNGLKNGEVVDRRCGRDRRLDKTNLDYDVFKGQEDRRHQTDRRFLSGVSEILSRA